MKDVVTFNIPVGYWTALLKRQCRDHPVSALTRVATTSYLFKLRIKMVKCLA